MARRGHRASSRRSSFIECLMKFRELSLSGVWLIDAEPFSDDRGVFFRHFCAEEFAAHGIEPAVVQGNISVNPHLGTLRGFHYQEPPDEESKTLSCLTGAIYDIVVDLRPNSQTFMSWVSVELSAQNHRSLHLPAGCANAWLTVSENTVVHYYMSELYSPKAYCGFRYNDPGFGFDWPMEPKVISDKDNCFPDFEVQSLKRM